MRLPAPARLYLRRARADRPAMWVIKDHGREIGTGCHENDRAGAEASLRAHVERGGIKWDGARFIDLTSRPAGTVYFVTSDCMPDYPIKVGFTDGEMGQRLRALQNGNPHKLMVLGTMSGKIEDELAILKRFANLRMESEWLQRTDELMDFITGARAR